MSSPGGCRVSIEWLTLFLREENIKSSVKVHGELRAMKEKAMLLLLARRGYRIIRVYETTTATPGQRLKMNLYFT